MTPDGPHHRFAASRGAGLAVLTAGLALLMTGLALLAGGSRPAIAAPAWRLPLDGAPAILRRFVPPPTPYAAGGRGVDLAAAQGARVFAAGEGVVGYAGRVAGVPVVTVLHAGGLRTTYEPVAAGVRAGMRVLAGSVLGTVAGRHASCPVSCLHWGLLRGEVYLDPLSLLGRGPVRLLPLGGSAPPVAPGLAVPTGPVGTPPATPSGGRADARGSPGAGAGGGAVVTGLLGTVAVARALYAGRRMPRPGGG